MSSLRGIMLKSLILLIALPYISQAFTMRRQYRRPVCEPNQSCSYDVMGMQFAFCDCPGPETRCPMNPSYTIDQRGTTYHFCAHREITVCEIGEVATTVDSIQTAIHCICPDSMELIKKDESNGSIKEFVCEEKRMCETRESCGVTDFAGTRSDCVCPMDSSCVYPETEDPFSPVNGTCIALPIL